MNHTPSGAAVCYGSSNGSCLKHNFPVAVKAPLYILFLATICLTVCGNLIVIIAISHFRELRKPTNYLVLSLAVVDFLLGGFIMPPSMVRSLETCWYFGRTFCKIHSSTDVMLSTASILNLSFISIDRYYAVCQPLHYPTKITTSVIVAMIMITWTLSALIGFGMIFLELNILGIEDFYYNHVDCVGGCSLFQSVSSSTISSIMSFYIPGFLMLATYHKIFLVAKRQARSIQSIAAPKATTGNIKVSQDKMERKATKTLAIVMGVFLSCWTPFFVCNIMDPITGYNTPAVLFDVLVWVGYLNSTLNPIVYAFFYTWFRKAFHMIVFCKIFKRQSSRAKLISE